jgi:hypothetical protein
MLSCRTGRGPVGTARRRADFDDGAAGATRSVARRLLLARPSDRDATTSAARPPVSEPRSADTSRRPLADRSRALPSRRAPGACRTPCVERGQVSARPRASVRKLWTGAVVHRNRLRRAPRCSRLHRLTGGQLEEPQISSGPPVLQSLWAHEPPPVVGLSENVLQKRGRHRSVRDSVAEDKRASAGHAQEAVPGARLPGRVRTQPQDRGLSTGCPGSARPAPADAGPRSLADDAPAAAATGEQPETVIQGWL